MAADSTQSRGVCNSLCSIPGERPRCCMDRGSRTRDQYRRDRRSRSLRRANPSGRNSPLRVVATKWPYLSRWHIMADGNRRWVFAPAVFLPQAGLEAERSLSESHFARPMLEWVAGGNGGKKAICGWPRGLVGQRFGENVKKFGLVSAFGKT